MKVALALGRFDGGIERLVADQEAKLNTLKVAYAKQQGAGDALHGITRVPRDPFDGTDWDAFVHGDNDMELAVDAHLAGYRLAQELATRHDNPGRRYVPQSADSLLLLFADDVAEIHEEYDIDRTVHTPHI